MKKFYFHFLIGAALTACTNLEDAELTRRQSFIRFYEGANPYVAAEARQTPDGGFVVAGTILINSEPPENKILIIKTNNFGGREWQTIVDGGRASSIMPVSDGYVVVGDRVEFQLNTTALENTWARLIKVDMGGNVQKDISYRGKTNNVHIDFKGTGITASGTPGNFITLGTFQRPGQQKFAVITELNLAAEDTVWSQIFDYQNRDYVNTRSVFYNDGSIVWGSSITETVASFSKSYLAVPRILANSTFLNSNYYGEDFPEQQFLKFNDLKQVNGGAFAAVGTYSQSDGSKSNVFFIRINKNGTFSENSIRYYDFNGDNIQIADPSQSAAEDNGNAITPTSDGGFAIAGSTINLITGGSDIWLFKIDAAGNPQWSKIIGGRSSETISSIEQTTDGGLLLCGTLRDGNSLTGGSSSMFIIKTDANGELTK